MRKFLYRIFKLCPCYDYPRRFFKENGKITGYDSDGDGEIDLINGHGHTCQECRREIMVKYDEKLEDKALRRNSKQKKK